MKKYLFVTITFFMVIISSITCLQCKAFLIAEALHSKSTHPIHEETEVIDILEKFGINSLTASNVYNAGSV
jgi:hypothetical protein